MRASDEAGPALDAMCDDIVERYHAPLHRALPRIQGDLAVLAASPAAPAFTGVAHAFAELADEVHTHLAKEENLLFPALGALAAADREGAGRPTLPFATVLHPIRMMEAEHMRIGRSLERLREAAQTVPEPAALAPQWQHCLADLADLDRDLREHLRAEDEMLFPQALELERRLL
jgi:regulator of cell morphogenesis and NO signaling